MKTFAGIAIGALATALIGVLLYFHWEQNVRFFRAADSYKSHYKSQAGAFDALATEIERGPVLGKNSLCLKPGCVRSKRDESRRSYAAAKLKSQGATFDPLIAGLGFAPGKFLSVLDSGEVQTIPNSFRFGGFLVNSTLHYSGGEEIDISPCGDAPQEVSEDECALHLSDTWLVKYQWMHETILFNPLGDDPDSPEAKCEPKMHESFAAYTKCVQSTPGKPAKLRCDGATLSEEEFNACIDDLRVGIRREH